MEGRATESCYFDLFRTAREHPLQYKPVSNPKDKSKPGEVYDRLDRAFRAYERSRDEGWLVIDRDAWTESELDDVCRKARARGYHVALSNPCFELWLYLHKRDNRPFADRHECQRALGEILANYSPDRKGSFDPQGLREGIEAALERAAALDQHPDTPWPRHQATRVYRLVRKLMSDPTTENTGQHIRS